MDLGLVMLADALGNLDVLLDGIVVISDMFLNGGFFL
jgi:hypothetical protein